MALLVSFEFIAFYSLTLFCAMCILRRTFTDFSLSSPQSGKLSSYLLDGISTRSVRWTNLDSCTSCCVSCVRL